jgi:hypothetical protein
MYEKSSTKKPSNPPLFQDASCVTTIMASAIQLNAKFGTGPDAVCIQCHTSGDVCDQARAGFQSGLSRLDDAIRGADQVLGVAESSGMEVSEARLAQDQARDSLTKARVTIHSFRTDLVDQDIQAGLKIASKNLQGGRTP